jgi:hypothetical protein
MIVCIQLVLIFDRRRLHARRLHELTSGLLKCWYLGETLGLRASDGVSRWQASCLKLQVSQILRFAEVQLQPRLRLLVGLIECGLRIQHRSDSVESFFGRFSPIFGLLCFAFWRKRSD